MRFVTDTLDLGNSHTVLVLSTLFHMAEPDLQICCAEVFCPCVLVLLGQNPKATMGCSVDRGRFAEDRDCCTLLGAV